MTRSTAPFAPVPSGLERYRCDAGDAAEAQLTIPADARHERRFEIACQAQLRCGDLAADAWHEMAVYANGALQWRRRVPTHNPGSFDGLDYRFAATVPVGQSLKLLVRVQAKGGARRERLEIEAEALG